MFAAALAAAPALAQTAPRTGSAPAKVTLDPSVSKAIEATNFDVIALQKAVKELNAEIAALKAENADFKAQVTKLDQTTVQLSGVDRLLSARIDADKSAVAQLSGVPANVAALNAAYEKHTHPFRVQVVNEISKADCAKPGLDRVGLAEMRERHHATS